MTARRVVEGLAFFPRGGSAHVVRALARELPAAGWAPTIVCGTVPGEGEARRFFAGLDVRPLDFGPALASPDPMAHEPPMHPSYEDRPGAPDRVFAALDDAAFHRQVAGWARHLAAVGAADADVLHLHHLTPQHEAAAAAAPGVPVVGHLHGTELLMAEAIAAGPPAGWDHAEAWLGRLRRWLAGCAHVLLLSPRQEERAAGLLGLDPTRCTVVPNGFDPATFRPEDVAPEARLAHWRHHLCDEPRGWRPGEEAGSVGYAAEHVADAFAPGNPVLLYVGRFTEVKRVPLLIRAHARATRETGRRAPLVLLGGFPGEWEVEHPWEVAQAAGDPDVFLAGWHGHDALPAFLRAADAVVLASVREQFGQVLVEGMACGLPAVAVDAHGPADIVDAGATGWLVPPDDEAALAAALAEVIRGEHERARRGRRAAGVAAARYAWPALAARVGAVLDAAADLGAGRRVP